MSCCAGSRGGGGVVEGSSNDEKLWACCVRGGKGEAGRTHSKMSFQLSWAMAMCGVCDG